MRSRKAARTGVAGRKRAAGIKHREGEMLAQYAVVKES